MENTPKIKNNIHCPLCKNGLLYERVPRPFFIKFFLFFLPIKRYKCYSCGKKPYILKR